VIFEQLVPDSGSVELDAVLASFDAGRTPSDPFSDDAVGFFVEVARRLTANPATAAMPDIRALAFWMRRAHLLELQHEFRSGIPRGSIRLPRGLVFHLPPGNVDTIFMYSWMLAALCGNRNIVRLPRLRNPLTMALCAILNETLASPEFARCIPAFTVIGYGHDDAITAAISARSDVRVVWGGDATVERIRQIPLPPRTVELTFADRYSAGAIDARAFLDAVPVRRARLVEDFVSDTFAFDQGACSSPQVVVWCGAPEDATSAANAFFPAVADAARRRGYAVDAGTATAQTLAASALAADRNVRRVERYGRELLVVEVEGPPDLSRVHVGGGYLLSLRVDRLADLAPHLVKSDQTLTQFGFAEDELRDFARRTVASGGIDRIVPFGHALTFDRLWDGYDLLGSFTRTVRVTADPR
jgi:hypothetical protein